MNNLAKNFSIRSKRSIFRFSLAVMLLVLVPTVVFAHSGSNGDTKGIYKTCSNGATTTIRGTGYMHVSFHGHNDRVIASVYLNVKPTYSTLFPPGHAGHVQDSSRVIRTGKSSRPLAYTYVHVNGKNARIAIAKCR